MVCTQRCPLAARVRRLLVGPSSAVINPYGVRSSFGWVGSSQTGAYSAFPGLGHVERVTFSTRGSCPGALLALVGVHTEVCRTERLRLSSNRVRRNLTTGFVVPELLVPEERFFWWLSSFVRFRGREGVNRVVSWIVGRRRRAGRCLSSLSILYGLSARFCRTRPFGVGLCFGEPVVLWCVGFPPVKFPKPFPASFREIVVWFFRPVFPLRIVEPFDEI